jgi:uncharacterized protein
MPFSMFDLSVPVMLRGFGVLSSYIDKATIFAADNGIAPTVLVNSRLAPDMLSFAGQIQRASDNSKGAIARLAGIEVPSYADTESSFAELKDRVANTVSLICTVKPQQLEGSENRLIELRFKSFSGTIRGDQYVVQFFLPNFFFHLATAHDILRHNGLKIGKKDYFGEFHL